MKTPSIFSPAVAVSDGRRLLEYLLLLLASTNCCSSQQFDHIQLGRIADSIHTLTDSVKAQERTSERLVSGLMKMFTFVASDYLPCEDGWLKLGASCYFLSEDTSTWQESREKCIARDSDLVKVTTDEEYNFLRDLVKDHNTYVGLSDLRVEGTHVWTDGTVHPMIKSWWADGEPNNNGEKCIHYYTSKDGRFNDVQCSREFRYICEKSVYPIQDLTPLPLDETMSLK